MSKTYCSLGGIDQWVKQKTNSLQKQLDSSYANLVIGILPCQEWTLDIADGCG